jgi:two-component system, LytTR family, sensor kinase
LAKALLYNTRILIISLCLLVIWVFVHALILNVLFGFSWYISFVDSLVYNLLLAFGCAMISFILFYYKPTFRSLWIVISIIIALAALWCYKGIFFLELFICHEPGYFLFLDQSLVIRFILGLLVMGAAGGVSWFWYNLDEQNILKIRQDDIERMSREAELFTLRQKIQPHFLFNSLNSISALIVTRPEEARNMIQELSDFLRGTLKKEENSRVTVTEEIQHLELYLKIEKVRFRHRLNTIIEMDEQAKNKLVPAMILQPVVENAIKFGLYDTTEEVTIKIEVSISGNDIILRVTNPFDPQFHSTAGTGFGLSSIQRRLYLLYARNDLLTTSTGENLFITQIKIPQS